MKRALVLAALSLAACGVTTPGDMRKLPYDGQAALPQAPRAAAECVQTQLAEQKETMALAKATNTILYSPAVVSIHGTTVNDSLWLIDFTPDAGGGSVIQWRIGSTVMAQQTATKVVTAAIDRCRGA